MYIVFLNLHSLFSSANNCIIFKRYHINYNERDILEFNIFIK